MKVSAPKQSFVKHVDSAHWYQVMPDGTIKTRHEAGLREARLEKLYASPTSIEKDVRANTGLVIWIKNEIVKGFINNPRAPGEEDQEWADRVLAIADSIRDNAALHGTAVHKAIEEDGVGSPENILPFYNAYLPWAQEMIEETYQTEAIMHDPRIGVAGTVDRVVKIRNVGLTILDFKTQIIKPGKKAAFYDNFPRQLSFYAECYKLKHGVRPRIMSVVIDSQKPSRPVEKLYTQAEQAQSYKEFLCGVWLWCASKSSKTDPNGYWPVGEWSPNFPMFQQ